MVPDPRHIRHRDRPRGGRGIVARGIGGARPDGPPLRIDGDGFGLRPDHPGDAPAIARAFVEAPHLGVDWGIATATDQALARKWLTRPADLCASGEGRHFALVYTADDSF